MHWLGKLDSVTENVTVHSCKNSAMTRNPRKRILMTIDWRETLRTLLPQFESIATSQVGLHHALVETADDERDRVSGPNWLRIENLRYDGQRLSNQWTVSGIASLPSDWPSFRSPLSTEIFADEDQRVVRDRSGKVQAVPVPMRLRTGYYAGGENNTRSRFEAIANIAVQAILDSPDLAKHFLSTELVSVFRRPIGGVRYVFGEIDEPPSEFIARGWTAGVLQFENGVLIDLPIGESAPNYNNWLLLLHRIGWKQLKGSGLRASQLAWGDNVEVPWAQRDDDFSDLPADLQQKMESVSRTSFYSVLGTKECPLDVSLASVFAIQLLLSEMSIEASLSPGSSSSVIDYSKESWFSKYVPPVKSVARDMLSDVEVPQVGILVATDIERETVLKAMRPPRRKRAILQIASGNNTHFIGRLGTLNVALCLTGMGSIGRDASVIVTGEFIDEWKLKAVVMVGIAFGKDASKQSIGQVLVSDQIIPYEPARIGTDQVISRGRPTSASPLVLNRFTNAIGWRFTNPLGEPCAFQVGPILSGEKLVDDLDFKTELFKRHPTAIGGEMEGAGVAAAAERKKCDWIVVKAICDWGDGTKCKHHQAFAAASAVSLVSHVLSQVDAFSSYT
jgi:nucleoside phosphorylase